MNRALDDERSITEAECRQRTERVKEFAVARGLGAVVAFSATRAAMWNQTGHVGYIANWSNLDRLSPSLIVVPAEGDPVLLFSAGPAYLSMIGKVSWLRDIRTVASPDPFSVSVSFVDALSRGPEPPGTFGSATRQVLAERGLGDWPVGVVDGANLPYGVYLSLKRALGERLVEDVPDVIAALRAVKTPAEIRLHRKAAALADLGFEALARQARPGRWGHQVVAEMEAAVRGEGADYAHFWLWSCSADRPDTAMMLDIRPHDRLLGEGDWLASSSYVVYAGYWAHSMRCGSVGRPSEAQRGFAAVVSEMLEAAVAAARPGVPVREAVAASGLAAERAGYQKASRIGHGQGLDYSEKPFMMADNGEPFQVGNAVAIHLGLSQPDTGAGVGPVVVGDLCVVGEHGAEVLTRFPREPFVAR